MISINVKSYRYDFDIRHSTRKVRAVMDIGHRMIRPSSILCRVSINSNQYDFDVRYVEKDSQKIKGSVLPLLHNQPEAGGRSVAETNDPCSDGCRESNKNRVRHHVKK